MTIFITLTSTGRLSQSSPKSSARSAAVKGCCWSWPALVPLPPPGLQTLSGTCTAH